MVFSSAAFLLLFLPLFLVTYYIVPNRFRSLIILTGSYIFYGWWRVDFLLLFVLVTVVSHYVSRMMYHTDDVAKRKRWLTIGVVINLGVLGYFKYFNFGVDAFNMLAEQIGIQPTTLWSVILPIGVSFYIFQAVSYLVDVYRGDAEPAQRFVDFAAFIALFPQLIAGPVLRYKDLVGQFENRTHTLSKFNEGAIRFMTGFCKKVLIADTLAPVADEVFAMSDPTFVDAWVGVLAYTAQLYFDFSGYSDMAIGIGLMLGFRFTENFNQPYISRSITEFWRRWHISLSTWLRDYLYIPLGGNRKGVRRTYINLFLTMFLGGVWHGAGWTFVLWGIWHGGWLAIERFLGKGSEQPYPKIISWPLTLLLVMIGWVAFRAPDVATTFTVYGAMFSFNGFTLSDTFAWQVSPLQVVTLIGAYTWIIIMPLSMQMRNKNTETVAEQSWATSIGVNTQFLFIVLFMVTVTKMIAQSYSPFLYFQF